MGKRRRPCRVLWLNAGGWTPDWSRQRYRELLLAEGYLTHPDPDATAASPGDLGGTVEIIGPNRRRSTLLHVGPADGVCSVDFTGCGYCTTGCRRPVTMDQPPTYSDDEPTGEGNAR